jgi:hypothetical protein
MPCESSSLARPAFKRASARPTMRSEPNPISVGFPCHENLNTHFLVPDGETASQRPFPSQWRPGAAVSIICSVSLSPALRGRARIDCLAWTGEQNAAIAKLRRLIARYEDTRDLRLMGATGRVTIPNSTAPFRSSPKFMTLSSNLPGAGQAKTLFGISRNICKQNEMMYKSLDLACHSFPGEIVSCLHLLAASLASGSLLSSMRSTGCAGASHSPLPAAGVLAHALWLASSTTASPPRRSCPPWDERQNLTLSEGSNPDFYR